MADKLALRDQLLAKIREYHAYIESDSPKEAIADEMIDELVALAPHATISDLLFWGEKERSDEEVVEEALIREAIWREGGELPLLLHIKVQLEQGLSNTTERPVHRNYAIKMLPKITAEILQLKRETRH